MKKIATLALAASVSVLAGAALAQSSMSNMSATDQATMKRCQGMSQDMMQKDANCMAMMKKNPDMMKGTSGSGMSGSSNMNSNGSGMK